MPQLPKTQISRPHYICNLERARYHSLATFEPRHLRGDMLYPHRPYMLRALEAEDGLHSFLPIIL